MPATHAPTEYPRHPSHPNDYCRFAAEWIRAYATTMRQATYCGAALAIAARAFRRAYPTIAADVDDRLGSWPSPEPEFRALQNNPVPSSIRVGP